VKLHTVSDDIVPEVLGGLGDSLAVKANDNAAELLIAVFNVEEDLIYMSIRCMSLSIASTHLVGNLRTLGSLSSLGEEDKSDREDQQDRDDGFLKGSHGA
jgi:hypothetical protein